MIVKWRVVNLVTVVYCSAHKTGQSVSCAGTTLHLGTDTTAANTTLHVRLGNTK